MKAIETYLPVFPGFYGTIFEADEEPYIEDGKTYDDYEWDYAGYMDRVARKCTDFVGEELREFGITAVEFEAVVSPRFHNYSNDTINVTVRYESTEKVLEYLKENREEFGAYLKEHFTPCSGFIPFHSTDVDEWTGAFEGDATKFSCVLDFILRNESMDVVEDMHYFAVSEMYVDGTEIGRQMGV